MAVNQPTVRDRSRSPERPWLSRLTRTGPSWPRHRLTATARPVSSTSLAPPNMAAGTVETSGTATSAGRVTVTDRTVAAVSFAGSSGRVPSGSSGVARVSRQNAASCSWPVWAAAKPRNEAPTGSSSPPAAAWRRSSVMIRQETPSTTRWWMTRVSSRPSQTACSITPAAGSSRAIAVSRSGAIRPAARGPVGGTVSVPSKQARSRSCRSSSFCRMLSRAGLVRPAGVRHDIDW